jgi:hypothetical protein
MQPSASCGWYGRSLWAQSAERLGSRGLRAAKALKSVERESQVVLRTQRRVCFGTTVCDSNDRRLVADELPNCKTAAASSSVALPPSALATRAIGAKPALQRHAPTLPTEQPAGPVHPEPLVHFLRDLPARHKTPRCNTVQHVATQYNTVQHVATQHSAACGSVHSEPFCSSPASFLGVQCDGPRVGMSALRGAGQRISSRRLCGSSGVGGPPTPAGGP